MTKRVRIALISDIHGNAVALTAVLTDIALHGVDQVVCLGDVATLGPQPSKVIAMLSDACSHFIMGNHDQYMQAPELIAAHTQAPVVVDAVAWCRDALSTHEHATLAGFADTASIALPGHSPLLLFHGTPASNNVDVLSTTPDGELAALIPPDAPLVMAGGHTHLQMLRRHGPTWWVNPGSVGLPFATYAHGGPPRLLPHAEYAVVEASGAGVGVDLRRVPVPVEPLVNATRNWQHAFADMLLVQYQTWPR